MSSPPQPLELAHRRQHRIGLEAGHRIGAVVGGIVGARPVIAAGPQAAEGHVAGGAGRRTVEVDHARADAADEAVPVGRVVADQTGGQAVAGGVGGLDRSVECRDADHRQEGGEHLLVGNVDPGHVDDGRLDEGAGQVGDGARGADHLGAGVDPLLQRLQCGLGGAGRDQRSGVGFGIAVPGTEDQAVGQGGDGFDDRIALSPFRHDQAAGAGTALAGGDEGGLDCDARHGFGIRRIPDDQRIVAAQLQRQDDVGIVGELAPEVGARRAGAGEHQGVDRLLQQGGAGLSPALDQVEDAGRQVIGVDLLGHGSAPKPHEPGAYSDLTQRVLDRLPDEPCDLVGFSLGAITLLQLAINHPDRVRSLVLAGIGRNVVERDESGSHDVLVQALEGKDVPDNNLARLFVQYADQPGNDKVALTAIMKRDRSPYTPEQLARVTCPVLVAIGDQDFAGPGDGLVTLLPNARLVVLKKCDHFATTENFDFFDAALGFLEAAPS